jgi:small subunit ribosomal protein S4
MHSFKKFKVARRLGVPLFDKCQTGKFVIQRARTVGKKGPKKASDYAIQLTEKQKVRYFYNVAEKQFKNYVLSAAKSATPARNLFEQLEVRLDNVVYRLGFAATRQASRQVVSHGHITVNGRKVDIPSFKVSEGDIISFREGSKSSKMFEISKARVASYTAPGWLQLDALHMSAKVTGVPSDPDSILNFSSVIEFYSR